MTKLLLATEAIASGEVSRRQLARQYTMLHRNVYHRNGVELTAVDRAHAAWLWSGRRATVAGLSAAALLGSKWVPAAAPAELIRVHHKAPPGIVVHKDDVADDEIRRIGAISCTTVARTAFDIGRWRSFEQGLIRVDALLTRQGLRWPRLRNWPRGIRAPATSADSAAFLNWRTMVPNRRRRPRCGWCSSGVVCRGPSLRSRFATPAAESCGGSTWAGHNRRSASNTTVNSTGPIPRSMPETLTGTSFWPGWGGESGSS